MKPLIPTFKKMSLSKMTFPQAKIKGRIKLMGLLSEPEYVSHITKDDLILEQKGIIPLKAEYYYDQSLKDQEIKRQKLTLENKGRNGKEFVKKYSYFEKKTKIQSMSSLSSMTSTGSRNYNGKIKAKFQFHSPEQFIDFYKYYLQNGQPENDSLQETIKPKSAKGVKGVIKNYMKKNNKSSLFLTEPSERTRMRTTTISYPNMNTDTMKDNRDTSAIDDISILHFPEEIKLNTEENISRIKQKVQLYKLKEKISQMAKDNQLKEDSDKVRASGLYHSEYIRNGFEKNATSSFYIKKGRCQRKVASYIKSETAVRPFLYLNGRKWLRKNSHLSKLKATLKKENQQHNKKYTAAPLIQEIVLSELILPKKKQNQWMIDNETELKKEVISYQKDLGLFTFNNERGVFSFHSNSLEKGDITYKSASKYS